MAIFELINSKGDRIGISDTGAAIVEWWVSISHGDPTNIVLGLPNVEDYRTNKAYHGAIVGRYCNRLQHGCLSLSGKRYQLKLNDGEHHLHGGPDGFSHRKWDVQSHNRRSVVLSLVSVDGDQGYPGNLLIDLRYELDEIGGLNISWQAKTDQDTVVNISSHPYFNLRGKGDIRGHWLRIPAEHYTPVDQEKIPIGEIRDVSDTVFDLREFRLVDSILMSDSEEVRRCGGLDHNWAYEKLGRLQLQSQLHCPETQLSLNTYSTLPGIQCYTGNDLASDQIHQNHQGICFEPQYYPDSPNQPNFTSPVVQSGNVMCHTIRYHVSCGNREQK